MKIKKNDSEEDEKVETIQPEDIESEEEEKDKNKNRKTKKTDKNRMEKEFRKKEEALLEDSVPKDKNDFEKLLLEHPNSSYVWIQYMAYYLKLSEIEQARSVADRALQRIDPTYQDEKFNIWVALMNLENTFGTEKNIK